MTINTRKYENQNGFAIATEFHQFIESSVIPVTSLSSAKFWNAFTDVLALADSDQQCSGINATTNDDATMPRAATGALPGAPANTCELSDNASWGSLYEALYHDKLIPHTAGLKPGNGGNAARRDRVIACGKDFLDKTFPLREGSHRDAVSYLAYFQNLLVILADGSTTGLKFPIQYVGKNGRAEEPDSIVLEHNGTYTEVHFDRNGSTGATDYAAIDDIQLEVDRHTVFQFVEESVSRKCTSYRTWLKSVKHQVGKTFTDRNGDQCSTERGNRAIAPSATTESVNHLRPLVFDQTGTAVPQAAIDVLTAAVIHAFIGGNATQLTVNLSAPATGINDAFIARLNKMLAVSNQTTPAAPVSKVREELFEHGIKVIAASADTPPHAETQYASNAEGVANSAIAIISTMQSHGYDVQRAAAM